MKIIAIEEHTVSKEIDAATATVIKQAYPWYDSFLKPPAVDMPSLPDLFELGERRIHELDKAAIDMEILSYPNATQWLAGTQASELARQANDRLAQTVRAYPDRFGAFATLPLADPKAAAAELERCLGEHGFCGALISGRPQAGNVFLDNVAYYPVWEVLARHDLPVYVHPNYTSAMVCDAYYSGFVPQVSTVLSVYGFGWHLEAGIQVLRMILAGVFEKFPGLKVVSGHWGEIIPYYLARLDQMLGPGVTGLPRKISDYYREHAWVTPAGIYDYDNLLFCIAKLGIGHIIFATDFPYVPLADARAFVEDAPLSESDRKLFAHGNAEKLLHLK